MQAIKGKQYDYNLGQTSLRLNESQKEAGKYKICINEREFVVHKNVFSPKYFSDSEFFLENLEIVKGVEFLEIGPGIGHVSVFSALNGASRTVAVGINLDEVANTKENFELNGVSEIAHVMHGDLYQPVSSQRFDVIFCNLPFGFVQHNNLTALEMSVFDYKYKTTRRLIEGAPSHLKEEGTLLLGFSTTLGKYGLLRRFLSKSGFSYGLIANAKFSEGNLCPVNFELIWAKLRK